MQHAGENAGTFSVFSGQPVFGSVSLQLQNVFEGLTALTDRMVWTLQ